MKLTKKQKDNIKSFDVTKEYGLAEAVAELKKFKSAKFDESVDLRGSIPRFTATSTDSSNLIVDTSLSNCRASVTG